MSSSTPSASQGWDTHCHVFDPVKHPYISDTPYAPPRRAAEHLMAAVPASNFVIVMSVPEGTSTAHTLEAIELLHSAGRKGRGTVVMDPIRMVPDELQKLQHAGVRSVRIHTLRIGEDIDVLKTIFEDTARRIDTAGLKWCIDAQLSLKTWSTLIPTMTKLHGEFGTVFVVDHMFCCSPDDADNPLLDDLLDLVRRGIMYVKLSGLDRYSAGKGFEAFGPLVKRLVRADRGGGILFGSDWPHVVMGQGGQLSEVDTVAHLRFLQDTCESVGEGVWQKVWNDNAERLYA
ncbi:hypothetical protein EHS25_008031 [Saitozyma podzolica]|uniref:Amidohydrolase-related domain-containing protein n=1 Tax=Saitozyma podzolica TaxID=1890683 RepID=A0A427YND8_9TREE|nr:hypothetical protein EHS25_008031 [Saitozyma podzolica]